MLEFDYCIYFINTHGDTSYINVELKCCNSLSCILKEVKEEINDNDIDFFEKSDSIIVSFDYNKNNRRRYGKMYLYIIKTDKGLAIKNKIIFDPYKLLEID